jgi:hypothetical protein
VGQGEETVDTSFFVTEENLEKLEKARETNSVQVNLRLHSKNSSLLAQHLGPS